MNNKAVFILSGCIVIAALIIAFIPSNDNNNELGRYQLVFRDNSDCYVFDTKTGRLWFWGNQSRLNGVPQWEDLLPNLTKLENETKSEPKKDERH